MVWIRGNAVGMSRKLCLQYEGAIHHEAHLNPVPAKLLKREDSLRRYGGSLLEKVEGKGGEQHHGLEMRESAEQAAERLVSDLLAKAGRKEAELEGRPKSDKVKVRIAKRLRGQTNMSWKWIAERLSMGHWRSAANTVRLENRK